MSRKLTVMLLAMLVLVGAMGLKTVVVAHSSDGTVIMANGGAPQPPTPWPPTFAKNGGAPQPPTPWPPTQLK
jgi:hypothetical protein